MDKNICSSIHMTSPGTFITVSTEQTQALGTLLGTLLSAGDVLILTGDLGAGKTQLTKGIAAGMQITDDVTSPTFTIEMVYESAHMPLYHFDLYRLSTPEQLEDTGLYDVLDSDGPCVIEWGEQFVDEIGPDRMDVVITRLSQDDHTMAEPPRQISFIAHNDHMHHLIDQISSHFCA